MGVCCKMWLHLLLRAAGWAVLTAVAHTQQPEKCILRHVSGPDEYQQFTVRGQTLLTIYNPQFYKYNLAEIKQDGVCVVGVVFNPGDWKVSCTRVFNTTKDVMELVLDKIGHAVTVREEWNSGDKIILGAKADLPFSIVTDVNQDLPITVGFQCPDGCFQFQKILMHKNFTDDTDGSLVLFGRRNNEDPTQHTCKIGIMYGEHWYRILISFAIINETRWLKLTLTARFEADESCSGYKLRGFITNYESYHNNVPYAETAELCVPSKDLIVDFRQCEARWSVCEPAAITTTSTSHDGAPDEATISHSTTHSHDKPSDCFLYPVTYHQASQDFVVPPQTIITIYNFFFHTNLQTWVKITQESGCVAAILYNYHPRSQSFHCHKIINATEGVMQLVVGSSEGEKREAGDTIEVVDITGSFKVLTEAELINVAFNCPDGCFQFNKALVSKNFTEDSGRSLVLFGRSTEDQITQHDSRIIIKYNKNWNSIVEQYILGSTISYSNWITFELTPTFEEADGGYKMSGQITNSLGFNTAFTENRTLSVPSKNLVVQFELTKMMWSTCDPAAATSPTSSTSTTTAAATSPTSSTSTSTTTAVPEDDTIAQKDCFLYLVKNHTNFVVQETTLVTIYNSLPQRYNLVHIRNHKKCVVGIIFNTRNWPSHCDHHFTTTEDVMQLQFSKSGNKVTVMEQGKSVDRRVVVEPANDPSRHFSIVAEANIPINVGFNCLNDCFQFQEAIVSKNLSDISSGSLVVYGHNNKHEVSSDDVIVKLKHGSDWESNNRLELPQASSGPSNWTKYEFTANLENNSTCPANNYRMKGQVTDDRGWSAEFPSRNTKQVCVPSKNLVVDFQRTPDMLWSLCDPSTAVPPNTIPSTGVTAVIVVVLVVVEAVVVVVVAACLHRHRRGRSHPCHTGGSQEDDPATHIYDTLDLNEIHRLLAQQTQRSNHTGAQTPATQAGGSQEEHDPATYVYIYDDVNVDELHHQLDYHRHRGDHTGALTPATQAGGSQEEDNPATHVYDYVDLAEFHRQMAQQTQHGDHTGALTPATQGDSQEEHDPYVYIYDDVNVDELHRQLDHQRHRSDYTGHPTI